jgi:hypothetical protein
MPFRSTCGITSLVNRDPRHIWSDRLFSLVYAPCFRPFC